MYEKYQKKKKHIELFTDGDIQKGKRLRGEGKRTRDYKKDNVVGTGDERGAEGSCAEREQWKEPLKLLCVDDGGSAALLFNNAPSQSRVLFTRFRIYSRTPKKKM